MIVGKKERGMIIAQVGDEPWGPATDLGLPEGVEWRLYEENEAGDQTVLVRFPPGYVEPRHTHDMEHWDVIVEGEMHVDGKVLKRGDYLHGFPNEEHGPMGYPVGCTVFAVMRGKSPKHIYDEQDVVETAAAER